MPWKQRTRPYHPWPVRRLYVYTSRNLQKCADATSSGPFSISVSPSRLRVATWTAYDITNGVSSHAWTRYFPAECNTLMHNNVRVTTHVIININTVLTRQKSYLRYNGSWFIIPGAYAISYRCPEISNFIIIFMLYDAPQQYCKRGTSVPHETIKYYARAWRYKLKVYVDILLLYTVCVCVCPSRKSAIYNIIIRV